MVFLKVFNFIFLTDLKKIFRILVIFSTMADLVVIKKTFHFHTCSTCDGTGVRERKFRDMVFVKDCPDCEKGRRRFVTSEEVPLVEALKELELLPERQTNIQAEISTINQSK